MKRILCALLACVLAWAMAGCGEEAAAEPPVTAPTKTTEPVTEATEETTMPTEVTEPAPTGPEHSPLYLEGVPVEDVILWFNEVVLDTEFYIGGDPSLVQKWDAPIIYELHGETTEEDLAVLESFAAWLNTVEGFPGIHQAAPEEWGNLRIHFTDEQGLVELMGSDYAGLDGAVTFWYDADNRIYDETICIRTDLDQYLRNSVILEELYNGLGPVQDTVLRPDSLIYQEYAVPQELTPVDELLLRLLYHPDIQCGMNAAQCEAVIRDLYY